MDFERQICILGQLSGRSVLPRMSRSSVAGGEEGAREAGLLQDLCGVWRRSPPHTGRDIDLEIGNVRER